MRILLDNVNLQSSSGPNSFGRRLVNDLTKKGHVISNDVIDPEVQLSFIMAQSKKAKMALRLDGIYFNIKQDYGVLNEPIRKSFDAADLIVYQSEFNRKLTEKYFGNSKKSVVINNGTCLDSISKISAINDFTLDKFSEVW